MDGRVGKRSVKRKVSNKQFTTLGHCEIWSHFTHTLFFHLPSACDNTEFTREISHHTLTHVISLMYVGLSTILWETHTKKTYVKMCGRNYVIQTCACSKSVWEFETKCHLESLILPSSIGREKDRARRKKRKRKSLQNRRPRETALDHSQKIETR